MRIHCGGFSFISPRKDSPYVQVLYGVTEQETMPREEADKILSYLQAQGNQVQDKSPTDQAMGNVLLNAHWY